MTDTDTGTGADNEPKEPVTRQFLLITFCAQAATFTALGVLLWSYSDRPISSFIRLDLMDAFYGIALALLLWVFALVTYKIWPKYTERMARAQFKNFEYLDGSFPFSAIVVLSICAGVGEEALFRGGLQTAVGDVTGPHLAILISSALFALIHAAKPVITAIIFGIGVFFGYVYWLTDSLLLVMVAHTVYDVFAISALQKQFVALGVHKAHNDITNTALADPLNGEADA